MANDGPIQFAVRGGWINLAWHPQDPKPYEYLFEDGGTLLVGIENDDLFTLAWLDRERRLHTVRGFVPDDLPENTQETQMGVRAKVAEVECTVKLTIHKASPEKLHGTIKLADDSGIGTGPVGTFDADAHPSGQEGSARRSSPGCWLGWLRR